MVTTFGWSTLVLMTASLGTENSSSGPFSKPSWRSVTPSCGVGVVVAEGEEVVELGDGEPTVGLCEALGSELDVTTVGAGSLGLGSLGAALHAARPMVAAAATTTRLNRVTMTMPANLARAPSAPPKFWSVVHL